jgi:fatty-acyl-CoA synthase
VVPADEFNLSPVNNLSHVRGRNDVPLLEQTIPALLKATVHQFADHEAAVFCDQAVRWTFAEFDEAVDTLA